MRFPHTSAVISCRQVASGAAARSIMGGGDVRYTNRVLLKASAASVFVGGLGVTTASGVELPNGAAAPYLEIWTNNPQDLYVIGTGTVYIILEEPEGVH